jgi:hypothetical protein
MAKDTEKNAGKEKVETPDAEPLAGGIKGAGGPAVPISAEDVMTEQAKAAAKEAEKAASEAEKTAPKAEKPEEKPEEKTAKQEKK